MIRMIVFNLCFWLPLTIMKRIFLRHFSFFYKERERDGETQVDVLVDTRKLHETNIYHVNHVIANFVYNLITITALCNVTKKRKTKPRVPVPKARVKKWLENLHWRNLTCELRRLFCFCEMPMAWKPWHPWNPLCPPTQEGHTHAEWIVRASSWSVPRAVTIFHSLI